MTIMNTTSIHEQAIARIDTSRYMGMPMTLERATMFYRRHLRALADLMTARDAEQEDILFHMHQLNILGEVRNILSA